jgi:hypothetical protein
VLLAIAPERLIDCVLGIATPDAVLRQKPLLLNRIRRQGRRSGVLLPDRRGGGAGHPYADRVWLGDQPLSGLELRVESANRSAASWAPGERRMR